MPRFGAAQIVALATLLCGPVLVFAQDRPADYPEPNIVQSSWQLDFKFHHPQTIAVKPPGEAHAKLYHYITYTATNRTGADQLFAPETVVLTDAGDLVRANRSIPPAVFRQVRDREQNPLLEAPSQVIGQILQGPANARDSVVIWPASSHDVKQVHLFITGLSGEVHAVKDPATGQEHLLRKTLKIDYKTPGDLSHEATKPFVFQSKEWVVR